MNCQVTEYAIPINLLQPIGDIVDSIQTGIDDAVGADVRCDVFSGLLPSPLWSQIQAPAWEIRDMGSSSQLAGIKAIFGTMAETMDTVLAGFLDSIPPMPVIDISFSDFVSDNYDIDDIKLSIPLDALKAGASGLVPDPIYGANKDSPAQSIMDYIQAIMNNYMVTTATFFMGAMTELIDFVKDLFPGEVPEPIPGLPSSGSPPVPFLPVFPPIPIGPIQFPPPLDEEFSFALPGVGGITDTEFDLAQTMKNYTAAFSAKFLELITSFWADIASWAAGLIPETLFPEEMLTFIVPIFIGVEVI